MKKKAQAEPVADVVIGGGGFVGLVLALALVRAEPRLGIAVVDAGEPGSSGGDQRASAVSADVRLMLDRLGVWSAVEAAASPIMRMVITDARVGDVSRPGLLTFGGAGSEPAGEPLAYMVENRPLLAALWQAVESSPIRLIAPDGAADFSVGDTSVQARLRSGATVAGRLLVGADGSRSLLRDLAGIPVVAWRYGQSALVATVRHERDHEGIAYQHFLPPGPFARLPLRGPRSSLVWTEEAHVAEGLFRGSPDVLLSEMRKRFGGELGRVSFDGRVETYPLRLQIARRFFGPRFALVGDAGHTVHPLAGQGLNLGLRDAAALAETIVEARRLGMDIGSTAVLERYDRWRRGETLAMATLTDGLNRLFSRDWRPLRLVRGIGLGLVDRVPLVKDFLLEKARGAAGQGMPRLLTGEAI